MPHRLRVEQAAWWCAPGHAASTSPRPCSCSACPNQSSPSAASTAWSAAVVWVPGGVAVPKRAASPAPEQPGPVVLLSAARSCCGSVAIGLSPPVEHAVDVAARGAVPRLGLPDACGARGGEPPRRGPRPPRCLSDSSSGDDTSSSTDSHSTPSAATSCTVVRCDTVYRPLSRADDGPRGSRGTRMPRPRHTVQVVPPRHSPVPSQPGHVLGARPTTVEDGRARPDSASSSTTCAWAAQ